MSEHDAAYYERQDAARAPQSYGTPVAQLRLGLPDVDAQLRFIRRRESRRKWESRLTAGIRRHALAIHRGGAAQDMRILCPVGAGSDYCQWVAGHYGACVLGRWGGQRRLSPR